jgi:5-methylcytosine-specific restriction endonuclease McrA
MSRVFVLDAQRQPLMPCTPARARILLRRKRAAVFRHFPFTIILKYGLVQAQPQPLRLKLDPGSQITGLALVHETSGKLVFAAELIHRGRYIKSRLDARRAVRRNRRQRKTRYRQPRFRNRTRQKGWLSPSLASRLLNMLTWVARLRRLCPITAISQELVRFDTQALQDPEITGIAYQQGTLEGCEIREYLLEKWKRCCAYCGVMNVPLEIEHIVPHTRGGTDRVSNLTLACRICNQRKGTQTAEEFGHPGVQAQAQLPLKGAAAMNSIRWALYHGLQATGLPVEVGTGGGTRYNRYLQRLPKTHCLDAACVGASSPTMLQVRGVSVLRIIVTGRGRRQMCTMDRYGFPRTGPKITRVVQGFSTGDIVRAVVSQGKKAGIYIGRVAVRASGSFNVRTAMGTVQSINHRYCTLIHRCDGYNYQKGGAVLPSKA